ncbi:helix-turn-helix domain-containing protein [Actinophytocola sp. KF-1]
MGAELRLAREARGWSREQLVSRLPSGIGARALLSYEHGTRHLTLLRFVEVCQALGAAAPVLLGRALQRVRVHVENLALQVDVRWLVSEPDEKFLPLVSWANNKLVRHPSGVVEVAASAVTELADVVGCSRSELVDYLAKFVPDQTGDFDSEARA